MNKKLLTLLFILLMLSACSKNSEPNNIDTKPNFIGTVEKVSDFSILVKVDESQNETTSSDLISVTLNKDLKDSMTSFKIGDRVKIYYSGLIAESYPAQIKEVYKIIRAD